jgi:hypothetical protein
LADAYAVACITTYEHYRWRAYVKEKADKGSPVWSHTRTSADWQRGYLSKAKVVHLDAWCPLVK